jgi:hypothetical protein
MFKNIVYSLVRNTYFVSNLRPTTYSINHFFQNIIRLFYLKTLEIRTKSELYRLKINL